MRKCVSVGLGKPKHAYHHTSHSAQKRMLLIQGLRRRFTYLAPLKRRGDANRRHAQVSRVTLSGFDSDCHQSNLVSNNGNGSRWRIGPGRMLASGLMAVLGAGPSPYPGPSGTPSSLHRSLQKWSILHYIGRFIDPSLQKRQCQKMRNTPLFIGYF